jgi:hypothetical protein
VRMKILGAACCFWLALSASPAGAFATKRPLDPEGIGQLAPGEVLIVGEVHGTKQIPRAFLALVDQTIARAKVVSVGLEMPSNASLAGCNGDTSPGSLGQFWVRSHQDGRSSQAMRRLVCELKVRAAQGKVRLLYLGSAGKDFGQELARRIDVEIAAKRPTLVLIGNFHNRNTPQSVTGILKSQGRKVTALTTSSKDATAWNCTSQGCMAQPTKMEFCAAEPTGTYMLTTEIRDNRWDGCLAVGKVTSSPPLETAQTAGAGVSSPL